MVEIALYSNDSAFLDSFGKALGARLEDTAQGAFHLAGYSLVQLSLFDWMEAPADLCLVDLRDDPERNLEFAGRLRKNAGTELMVVAPGPQWAMRAYNLDVMSYFLDPLDAERTAGLILRRYAQRLPTRETQFSFRTAEGLRMLPAQRVVFVEYSRHRLLIHTDTGQMVTTSTMRCSFGQAAAQLLADPRFVRTHASFLVNILHISRFENFSLTMDTGSVVPVAHAKKAEVKRQFHEFFETGR